MTDEQIRQIVREALAEAACNGWHAESNQEESPDFDVVLDDAVLDQITKKTVAKIKAAMKEKNQ